MPTIKADEVSGYISAALEEAKRFGEEAKRSGRGHHGRRGGNVVFSLYYEGDEVMAEVPKLDLVEEFNRPLTPK